MSKMLYDNILYFCISLNDLPYDQFSVSLQQRYAYCRFYHVGSIINKPSTFNIAGVYDFLNSEPLKDISILKEKDWLFGEVLSFNPPLRGADKDWENIAYKIMRSGTGYKKISDHDLLLGIQSYLRGIFSRPIYSEIPKDIRGRPINEIIQSS